MKEDIRQVHYDDWARTKKFTKVEIKELEDKTWEAKALDITVNRDTKQQAIYAIQLQVYNQGYEIGNLPELFNIK